MSMQGRHKRWRWGSLTAQAILMRTHLLAQGLLDHFRQMAIEPIAQHRPQHVDNRIIERLAACAWVF